MFYFLLARCKWFSTTKNLVINGLFYFDAYLQISNPILPCLDKRPNIVSSNGRCVLSLGYQHHLVILTSQFLMNKTNKNRNDQNNSICKNRAFNQSFELVSKSLIKTFDSSNVIAIVITSVFGKLYT